MRTLGDVSAPLFRLRAGLVAGLLLVAGGTLAAQSPSHRLELSAAAGLHHFDSKTELAETIGFSGRVGYWAFGPVSLEGELSYAHPHTNTPIRQSLNTTTFAGWLVLNQPIGSKSSVFIRGGYGNTTYGKCPDVSVPGTGPCGSAGVLQGGIGARIGLTRNLLMRYDVTANRSLTTLKFSNLTAQGGLSVMLGGSSDDSDQDGVPDSKDRCSGTARGTTVDARGCTLDSDKDGVGDRFDRCPNTPKGLPVDVRGCPSDGDQDGVPDGLDQCNDTPRNTQVDAHGCPRDSDADGVGDPLDRCPSTPAGQRVDSSGCPLPAEKPGAPVTPQPKPAAPAPVVTPPRDTAAAPPAGRDTAVFKPAPPVRDTTVTKPAPAPRDTAARKPAPAARDTAAAKPSAPANPADRTWVVPGSVWTYRAAILDPSAFPVLDSIAAVLKADPTAKAEVIGHAYDRLIPADDVRLSQYRAEAVRSYLTFKGVPVSRITAVGHGSRPLIDRGTTEEARARNRRIEIRITHPGK